MKNLLEFILKNLVDKPEEVKVDLKENDEVELTFSVDKNDIGKVIGKQGKVIKSIRNLLKVRAIKGGKNIRINLKEA